MSLARRVVPVLLAAAALAGCEKKTPVAEDRAVLASYEALLFVPDPDLNALIPHAAWLGQDALPPALGALSSAVNDAKRVKIARLLEILAWNGYHSKESLLALNNLAKDRTVALRRIAIDGIFASGVEADKLKGYWDPAEFESSTPADPATVMRLPFDTCRTRLAALGVPIPKGPDGTVTGDPGRHPAPQPPMKESVSALHRWWGAESDPFLRIAAAIAALRLGDLTSAELLVAVLAPTPAGTKPSATVESHRACALRALKESTGQTYTTYEEWSTWWNSVKPKQKPAKPAHPQAKTPGSMPPGSEPPVVPPGIAPK
ncbi:MAG: hypothetical protein K8T20_07055 [Planctomycetes bacterium]|nr:hypothetical protein [Planctomycetota bacterium]